MKNRNLTIALGLATIALVGYLFLTFAPRAIEDYRRAAELNPWWGYIYLGALVVSGAAIVALSGWTAWILVANTFKRRARRTEDARTPSQMSASQKQAEITGRLAEGRQLAEGSDLTDEAREEIRQSLRALEAKQDAQRLEIVAFGTISSGKSSLLNALAGRPAFRTDARGGTTLVKSDVSWPGGDRVLLVDTPGLAEIQGQIREETAKQVAADADLVLLVVDGPLKDFEFEVLRHLSAMEKPVLVCLNKEDWFADRDRKALLEQLTEQVARLIPPENIVSVRAMPAARIRTRVLADGTQSDELVETEPDISALAARMQAIVRRDGRDLLLTNLLLQSRGLVREAKAHLRTMLDQKAGEVVDRATWQAAAAAALSPMPVVDLAAGMGITSHMVLSLARVYEQPVDLELVGRLLGELGKQLVSITGANLAAPLAASAIASMLKTVPGAGTLSGGILQGLVQALMTRWIGRVFIVYFREEMQGTAVDLASVARREWVEVTRGEELARLVKSGLARLGGKQ